MTLGEETIALHLPIVDRLLYVSKRQHHPIIAHGEQCKGRWDTHPEIDLFVDHSARPVANRKDNNYLTGSNRARIATNNHSYIHQDKTQMAHAQGARINAVSPRMHLLCVLVTLESLLMHSTSLQYQICGPNMYANRFPLPPRLGCSITPSTPMIVLISSFDYHLLFRHD